MGKKSTIKWLLFIIVVLLLLISFKYINRFEYHRLDNGKNGYSVDVFNRLDGSVHHYYRSFDKGFREYSLLRIGKDGMIEVVGYKKEFLEE